MLNLAAWNNSRTPCLNLLLATIEDNISFIELQCWVLVSMSYCCWMCSWKTMTLVHFGLPWSSRHQANSPFISIVVVWRLRLRSLTNALTSKARSYFSGTVTCGFVFRDVHITYPTETVRTLTFSSLPFQSQNVPNHIPFGHVLIEGTYG